MMKLSRRELWVTAAGFLTTVSIPALSQSTFPSRSIRLVVPFPPGGSTDVAARTMAERLSNEFGHPVIVENRPGAGTTIAAAYVASSPADGHTLYITGTISHASAAALYTNLTYDPIKSFEGVGFVTESPFILVVNSASPHRSVQDLIQAARTQQGAVTYSSSGNGAAPHLITELMGRSAGVRFLHIPYKGVGPALNALLANEVQFTVADAGAVPLIAAGRLRALSVLSANPSPMLNNVAGLSTSGIRDVDISSNLGILAPAGTPAAILDRLNSSINRALAQDDIKAKLSGLGQMAVPRARADFHNAIANDVRRYASVVKEAGIRID
jgi:tripartite-type tricarboxylate transporter receptor subunit TctC